MKKVNVLYLSYDGLTDPLGQSQILPYIKGLSKEGYEFTILSFEKEDRFDKTGKDIKEMCNADSIKWKPLIYHRYPPVLSTLFDIWMLWRSVKHIYKADRFDIIHCRSYITSLIGLQAKKKWGVKFIFDMRGFWADERVEGDLWNLDNPLYKAIYKFFKKKEKHFLISADHVVSLTNNARQEIKSWKLGNVPITVIPTCVDLSLFDPMNINGRDQYELRLRLGIDKNDFVLLYLGSWGTWYLVDEMLNFFVALKKNRPEAKFLILSGDEINIMQFPHKEDVIITKVFRQLVPLYVSIANASVCFIKPSFSKKASSATKIGELLSMNVPVIANEGWGDIGEMVDKKCGLIRLGENSIHEITSNFATFDSRKYCIEWLSLESGVTRYKQVYEDVCATD